MKQLDRGLTIITILLTAIAIIFDLILINHYYHDFISNQPIIQSILSIFPTLTFITILGLFLRIKSKAATWILGVGIVVNALLIFNNVKLNSVYGLSLSLILLSTIFLVSLLKFGKNPLNKLKNEVSSLKKDLENSVIELERNKKNHKDKIDNLNSKIDAYSSIQEQYNQFINAYGQDIFKFLINFKGKSYFTKLIELSYKVEEKHHDDERLENLQHILYKIIADNYFSIRELSNYKIPPEKLPDINYPNDLIASFKKSVKSLKELNNHERSYAWNVSLITPEQWTDKDWSDYLVSYLEAASEKQKIDIRRIHLIIKKDYNEKYSQLYELMIVEQLFGIDSKVVVIDREEINKDIEKIVLKLKGIMIFDYAILNSYDGNYYNNLLPRKLVLCSDIIPYWEDSSGTADKKIYPLKDYYTFNLFKEHFMCLWNLKEFFELKKINYLIETKKAIEMTLFQIILDKKTFGLATTRVMLDNILKYLKPYKTECTDQVLRKELKRALDEFMKFDISDTNLRNEFDKIFSTLIVKPVNKHTKKINILQNES